MQEPADLDVAFIGAGHNGLTCAAYLARAGLRVALFESRNVHGGAAVTEEFHPGFRNSTASYTVSLLNPAVIRELNLARHGLVIRERPLLNYVVEAPGRGLRIGPGGADTRRELARRTPRDVARYDAWQLRMEQAVRLLRQQLTRTPPTNLKRASDLWSALRFGRDFRALPLDVQRTVHELFTRSAGDVLDGWFEDEGLKAALGFDSIVGNYASPYAPGSAYVMLHHAFGEVNGRSGQWGHAVGGMGAISDAIAREAMAHGARIHTDAPVTGILVEDGRARGLTLADGRTIRARSIVANVSPRRLYLELLDPAHVPEEIRAHMRRFRAGSASFRVNVALSELPRFDDSGPAGSDLHRSGILIAPNLAYMDRAHAEARLTGMSREPVIEMVIPSTLDDSLAPPGMHVGSLFCQHFAPVLPDAQRWEDQRQAALELIIETVTRHAPNFRRSIVGVLALSPYDLEQRFGLPAGDIFHGALGLDQLWAARPLLGFGDYRTCVKSLYLCGSGAHPGGGVTGLPGRNCAARMLRDLRKKSLPSAS